MVTRREPVPASVSMILLQRGGFVHDVEPGRREHTTRAAGLFLLLE